jgi:hypothetical protein
MACADVGATDDSHQPMRIPRAPPKPLIMIPSQLNAMKNSDAEEEANRPVRSFRFGAKPQGSGQIRQKLLRQSEVDLIKDSRLVRSSSIHVCFTAISMKEVPGFLSYSE